MAGRAADLARRDLGGQPGEADLVAGEAHHLPRLRADVVEVEHADVALAAVDASGRHERRDRVPHVALMPWRSPQRAGEIGVQTRPSRPRCGPATVTVGADDFAPIELSRDPREQHAAAHQRRDVRALRAQVVELEDDGIAFPAVSAAFAVEVGENEGLRFGDTARL